MNTPRLRGPLLTSLALAAFAVSSAQAAADFTPLPSIERVMVTAPKPMGDFQLTDQAGKPFRLSSLQGQPALIFFGFAHCADICPAALQKLLTLQKSAPQDMHAVRVVMISIDGDRDTPESMRQYLAAFSPDFVGLTGPVADVREIAARFSATFFKDPPKNAGGDYGIQHTSRVFALDRKGRLRAELYDASVDATGQVVHALLAER
jgi:protein SCO1/2